MMLQEPNFNYYKEVNKKRERKISEINPIIELGLGSELNIKQTIISNLPSPTNQSINSLSVKSSQIHSQTPSQPASFL